MELEIGDIVLCTVERVEKTIVFVKIHYRGEELKGSIVMSEIAPGRIRNVRQYAVPKKKIVCKVLRISENRIELSLRRVTQKEKKEVLEQCKQEKSYAQVLKGILGKEKSKEIIKEIEKENTVYNFLETAKESPKILEEITDKEKADKIIKIIKSEKKKKSIIKKEFLLKSNKPNGLELIKNLLNLKDVKTSYISGGHYLIKLESEDLKKASQKIKDALQKIKDKAKKEEMEFSVVEKK